MKKTAYHPLRKLAVGGNPNQAQKAGTPYAPPLTDYLMEHDINPVAFQAFTKKVNGEVVTPFDPQYSTGRMESDLAFNKFPLFLVYCTCSADVVETIKFCNQQKLPVC